VTVVEKRVRVVANARVLQSPPGGIRRYTAEVLARMDGRVGRIAPRQPLRGIAGHVWEQAVLPARARRRLLWSPGNSGPLAVSRQVVTIHDASVLDHPEWFQPRFATWYGLLLPRLVRRVHRVLTDSEFSRARLIEHGNVDESKVEAIPIGVGHDFYPAPPEAIESLAVRLHLPENYVLVLGSLEPRKNLGKLFDAWRAVSSRVADSELIVAGAPGAVFRGTGFNELPARARLVGRIDDADLAPLYSGARLFVYPSLYEGFGLPPLEAMACGTPVIASNSTALPEVVGNAALLVDASDHESIAAAIEKLLDDEEFAHHLRQLGLARAAEFSWDRTARRTWEALADAAHGKESQRPASEAP
jgi:glycosyltransferase involved in cell wall biosynthesis